MHAIAILTEWRLSAELDYEAIFKDMVKPAFIFDGRNILDHRRLYELGFNVYAVGKAPLTHFGNRDSGLGILVKLTVSSFSPRRCETRRKEGCPPTTVA